MSHSLCPPAQSYVFFMQGDSNSQPDQTDAEAMACGCTPGDVVNFLLVVEEGMILGCNGREASSKGHAVPPRDWWDRPLGTPLGPPVTSPEGLATRKFASGTVATMNLKTKEATVSWGSTPI